MTLEKGRIVTAAVTTGSADGPLRGRAEPGVSQIKNSSVFTIDELSWVAYWEMGSSPRVVVIRTIMDFGGKAVVTGASGG
jgi:hypothetical protein